MNDVLDNKTNNNTVNKDVLDGILESTNQIETLEDPDIKGFTPVENNKIIQNENNSLSDNIMELKEDKIENINEPDEIIGTHNDVSNEIENLDESISLEAVNDKVDKNSNVEKIDKDNILPSNAADNLQNSIIEDNSSLDNKLESNDCKNEELPNSDNTLLGKYATELTEVAYVCNPSIGRDKEIKQMILTLLTPEKSAILVGKPGIGKTAIVEGLAYQMQRDNIPNALKGYKIYKLNTSSLLGNMPNTNEPKIQVLLNELKTSDRVILFIDEIHTLIGAGAENGDSLDFANIFKPGLDRGNIKIIGATTSDEYDRYILTDKAFVRRFQKIEILEPSKELTVKILMGSLPKLEQKTGAVLKYTSFIQEKIMTFIVDLTSEYRRVYEISARYPDIALTILQQAFSYAVFDNKTEVNIRDVRKAIANTNLVYPDVIKKELIRYNEIFTDIYRMETIQRLKGETSLSNE